MLRAVGDDGDLEAADLVAVPARRLLAGERRGGAAGDERAGVSAARGRGTGQHGAASQIRS